jgi:hypothetical protein
MTRRDQFTGARVELTLVDPWEFVTMNGSGPFTADVLEVGQDRPTGNTALLLELHLPLRYNNEEYKHFIASTRHEGASLELLFSGIQVSCGLIAMPVERLESADPFDLSWWRGGVAAVADITLQQ